MLETPSFAGLLPAALNTLRADCGKLSRALAAALAPLFVLLRSAPRSAHHRLKTARPANPTRESRSLAPGRPSAKFALRDQSRSLHPRFAAKSLSGLHSTNPQRHC